MPETMRMKLLAEIIYLMQEANRPHYLDTNLDNLYVTFRTKRKRSIGDLPLDKALDAMMNDVYNFADFDISDAVSVELMSY